MYIDYVSIGEKIKNARKEKGLSQQTLAEMVNCSTSYISYIETAEKCLSLNMLILIANALNLSADDILQDSLVNVVKIKKRDFSKLLLDCTEYEMKILLDILGKAKESIRQNREFFK